MTTADIPPELAELRRLSIEAELRVHRALLAFNHQLQRERWRTNALRRMLHDCGIDDASIDAKLEAQP